MKKLKILRRALFASAAMGAVPAVAQSPATFGKTTVNGRAVPCMYVGRVCAPIVVDGSQVSGTLPANVLPAPTMSTPGGVLSSIAPTHQYQTGVDATGKPTYAQPAAGDVSGLAPSATTDATSASNVHGSFDTSGVKSLQPFTAGQGDSSLVSSAFARKIGRPGVFNLDPANYSTWRIWLSYMRAGQQTPKLAIIGDSTTFGFQSITPATAMRYNGWPNKLAGLLTQRGIFPAQSENAFGECAAPASNGLPGNDDRFTRDSNWDFGFVGPCGGQWHANVANATLSFTSKTAIDTIDLYNAQGSIFGASYTYSIDGAAPTTVINPNNGAATTVVKTTISGLAPGIHKVTIVCLCNSSTNNNMLLTGIDEYSVTNRKIDVVNLGWYGALASGLNGGGFDQGTSPTGTAAMLRAISPNLTIIMLGINDYGSGKEADGATQEVASTTFTNALSNLVQAAGATGNVMIATVIPSQATFGANGSTALARQQAFNEAIRAVANTYGIAAIDINERWQGNVTAGQAAAGGFETLGPAFYTDGLHPSGLGYDDVARAMETAVVGNGM